MGRQRERALLNEMLTGGGPPLLLFAGEPGIGKSRLLEEVASHAEALGWLVLTGGCHRRSGQEPYAPWMNVLTRYLSTRSPAQQRSDLQGCAWLVKLLPELGELMLVPAPAWSLPVEQERRLMLAAVARFLSNVAGPTGTLLVLDDLHWAGIDALDVLASLLREPLGGRPVRVVGAYRDTDVTIQDPLPMLLADLARDGLAKSASLTPLDRDDAKRLLTLLLDGALVKELEVPDDAWRGILSRAGGVPYNLVSCAQEARMSPPGVFFDELAVPWSVAESIRQRVSSLPEPGQEILAIAAVGGRQVTRAMLLQVAESLGHGEGAILRGLEAAGRARLLIEDGENRYVFAHDLIRETLEGDLSAARRAVLSRRVAEALERLPRPEQRAAELAWYFARGDELARALPYALSAGDQAEAVYAHAEAERHYRSAIEWAGRLGDRQREGEALEKLADILYLLARFSDAYDCLDQAIHIYRDSGDWDRLAWATAQIARAGDPLDRVESSMARLEDLFTILAAVAESQIGEGELRPVNKLSLGERAARAVSILTPKTAARVYLCLTTRLLFLGRPDEVYEPSEQAIRYAYEVSDFRIESLSYSFRSNVQLAQGRMAEYSDTVEHAYERARSSGDLEALYVAIVNKATLFELRGEPLQVRDMIARSLEVATQLGNVGYIIGARNALAYFEFELGEWNEAVQHFIHAAQIRVGNESGEWSAPVIGRALLLALRGESSDESSETLAYAERVSDDPIRMWATVTLAERDILGDQADDASARLRRAIEQTPLDSYLASYLFAPLAWAELSLGDLPGATETLLKARQLASVQQNRKALVDIERIAALVAFRGYQWEEAWRALDASLAICEAAPFPYAEAKARYVAGQLYVAQGAPEQAREEYAKALAICERLRERLYRTHIERALQELSGADSAGR